jgi:hypothetical protein
VRLKRRPASSLLPWSLTVIVPPPVDSGKYIVLVPRVQTALRLVPVDPLAPERGERALTGLGELHDADGAAPREEPDRPGGPVGQGDLPVLDMDRAFDPSSLPAVTEPPAVLGGRDPVHAKETELPKKALMMGSAKRCVVDDAKGAGDLRREATKAVHRDLGFTARVRHPLGVQNYPPLCRTGKPL